MEGIGRMTSAALLAVEQSRPQTMGSAVGLAMLGKSLDEMNTMGDSTVKMMEQSVTPYLGGNIDFSV